MTTDAINYLEAFALGYAMSSKEAYTKVMKAIPSWNGVFRGATGDLFKGIASTLKIEMDTRQQPIVSIIKALKQAEELKRSEMLRPRVTQAVLSLTPDELDHLDKTIEELRRVKRKQSA